MSDERFNELVGELIGGLPVTLIINRLVLALRVMVEEVGGEQEFEKFVSQYREKSQP